MSRLLWFVLGGVATAVGAGIAAVMLDGESDGDPFEDTEEGQETIALGNDSGGPAASEGSNG